MTEGLLAAAMKGYGLEERHVVASRVLGTEVVIVTAGGEKIRYRLGDTPRPLSPGRKGDMKTCGQHGEFGADAPSCPRCRRERIARTGKA